jgi:hypothetical protein
VISAQVGVIDRPRVRYAEHARRAIPEMLHELVESASQSRALLLAMLLSRDAAVQTQQRAQIAREFGAPFMALLDQLEPVAAGLPQELRLPALQQLFPTLRRLSAAERRQLELLVSNLAAADARIDVFECCLQLLMAASLREELAPRPPHGGATVASRAHAIHVVFAVVARHGTADARGAQHAYEIGIGQVLPRQREPYRELANWPSLFDAALRDLTTLQPLAKEILIQGLVRSIAHDDRLTVPEAELLRTICSLLHCPLPPLLPAVLTAQLGERAAGQNVNQ